MSFLVFYIVFPFFCRDSEPSSSSRSAAPPNYAPPLLPPETEGGHVSSPIDPQREASRVKREQRRERDREHHRESRGSAQRGSRGHRSDRESSVPHSEQEYAISTKARGSNGQRQSNKSRERSRGSGSGGGHGGRSGENNNGGRSGENNSERPLSQHEQQLAVTTAGITDINLEPCKFFHIFIKLLHKLLIRN